MYGGRGGVRIHSIRLEHFRGVAGCTVAFAERGVTIVEGPNEVGKSSLAEALGLLLNELDSSKKEAVRSTKPVDRDDGPLVEAEISTGPYRFLYRKRFLKRAETALTVSSPRPQNLTGREAHERATQILEETMDLDLWKALQVQQGEAIRQADLHEKRSLLDALGRVAGQEAASEQEMSLFERVKEEYLLYFTETGRPAKTHAALLSDAADARSAVEALERELRTLEALVDRSAELERSIATHRREVAEHAENEARRAAEKADLDLRKQALDRLEFEVKNVTMGLEIASNNTRKREELIARFTAAREKRISLEADAARGSPDLRAAEEREAAARTALADAETRSREADRVALLRSQDFEYGHALLELQRLVERKGYIEKAQQQAAEARRTFAEVRITEEAFRAIRKAHDALMQAEARLEVEAPQVQVRALSDVEVEINGDRRRLAPGEQVDIPVPDSLQLLIPGQIGVAVRAGVGGDTLKSVREGARTALTRLLDSSGTRDVEHAEAALGSVRAANTAIAAAEEQVRVHRRDLTPAQIDEKIRSLQVWKSYPADRPPGPPLIADHDPAEKAKKTAQAAQAEAKAALDAARERWRVADEDLRGKRERARDTGVELRVGAEAERAAERELVAARAKKADDALANALAEAAAREAAAQETWARARAAWQALNPENVVRLAENAARALKSAEQGLADRERDAHVVRAELELRGERGLFEAAEEARARLARAEQVRDAAVRRAAAADLLYKTMVNKREEARQAYLAPLREKIEQLGRLVFDDSFCVELDDGLAIVARTLGGRTVPFVSLSGGAREQLSLIARLAAALLVDETEGVPLIFDDTLGHTDPTRLEGMGAMLALAGDRCQVIVLTCTPGRFRHVGGAKLASLGERRA